jgi:hypothetical protein
MLEVMSKSERLQRCGSLKRTPSSPRSPTSPSQGIQFDQGTVIASAPSLSPLCCMTLPMCEPALTAPQLHGPVHQRRQPGPLWTVNSLLHRSMLTLCAGVARQQHSGDRPQWIW